MCFLYRQSISIVYESKFKYIYRYFIKIDRCFCGILQSLPLRKCGLKFYGRCKLVKITLVTSLAEVWIEIVAATHTTLFGIVTSLAEVWIEIKNKNHVYANNYVTSLAEVWIEIFPVIHSLSLHPSLPLRKCGLKSHTHINVSFRSPSLPLRKCGLKSHGLRTAGK